MATSSPKAGVTGEQTNISSMFKVTVTMGEGQSQNFDTRENSIDDKHFKVDLGLGAANKTPDVNEAYNDRVRSIPSGWNIDGTVDSGDGFYVTNTVWADDHEHSVEKGELTYFRPLAPTNADYNSLTT